MKISYIRTKQNKTQIRSNLVPFCCRDTCNDKIFSINRLHCSYELVNHSCFVVFIILKSRHWHRSQVTKMFLIVWTTNKQTLWPHIQLAPHSGSNICGIGWSVFVREVGRWLTRATVASSPWEPEPSLAAARRPAGCKVKGGSGSPNFRSMCLHPQPTKQPDFCLHSSVSWSPQK